MMKTRRFLFLLAALLGLSGCPETPCFGNGGVAQLDPGPGVILVGGEVRLPIQPTVGNGCGGVRAVPEEVPTPESLSVEVSGPDNLPVAAQGTLGNPPTSAANVKFTPDKPGRYHVFAAFDPVGGIHQFDMYAARDRSSEAPVSTLQQGCGALERTRRGGWLCDTDFVRDGTVVRRFTGARVAVAGDAVWVVLGVTIQRYVDTGTALELSASMTSSLSSPIDFLLAAENELVAARGPGIERYVYTGTTTLAQKGSAFSTPSSGTIGSTGLKAILVRTGDQLATITAAGTSQPQSNAFVNVVCPYLIEPERITRTVGNCETINGDLVGFEQNVLWMATRFSFGEGFADLRRLEWTGSAMVEQASLPLGQSFKISTRGFLVRNSAVPVLISPTSSGNASPRSTVAVYSPDRRAILLEMLDSQLGDPLASSSLLWGSSTVSSTGIRIRVRPTTP